MAGRGKQKFWRLTDGSMFSIKQLLELNLQRAGNYRKVNYISFKALVIIRPLEIEKNSGLRKSLWSDDFREEEDKVFINRVELVGLLGPGGHFGEIQRVLLVLSSLPELQKLTKKWQTTHWRKSWLCTTVWMCCAFIFSVYPQTFWPKGGFVEVAAGVADSIA